MKINEVLIEKEIPTPFNKFPKNAHDIMDIFWEIESEFITLIMKQNPSFSVSEAAHFKEKFGNVVTVKIKDLIPMEPTIDDSYTSLNSKLPSVYLYKNKMYVNDGNHRVSQAFLKGNENIEINLIDIQNLIKNATNLTK